MLPLLLALAALAAPPAADSFDLDDGDSFELPADPADGSPMDPADASLAPTVAGGEPVPESEDRWDPTVGIVYNNRYVGCTGTLIAPRVVLTAAHCLNGVTSVIIGAKNWALDSSRENAEIIRIVSATPHPSYRNGAGADIAVLVLSEPSTYPTSVIGTDCIRDEYLDDGVDVAVVGYGATRHNGRGQTSAMHYGFTKVQDYACHSDFIDGIRTGCLPSLRPGRELGAGGTGVDACFGDSGGPLYLPTPQGDYVVGVVSRAYLGAPRSEPCRAGGIYVRPDAFVDWIESVAGVELEHPMCNEAPIVGASPIETRRNQTGTTTVVAVDPDGDDSLMTFEITRFPENGLASVDADGVLTFIPNPGFVGLDSVVVTAIDGGSEVYPRSARGRTDFEIPIEVGRRFLGCSSAAIAPVGSLALLGGLLVLARRRRR